MEVPPIAKQIINAISSISLDLDNKWSYLRTRGDPLWQDFPSYLNLVVPRILEFLEHHELTITFFVVGKDAEMDENRDAFQALAESAHEIANHSYLHEPWLHLYEDEALHLELERAEETIEAATGRKVLGFRGPGYSLSRKTLAVLNRRGYRYDATTFPNALNPLARAYFFAHSNLDKNERERRKHLFGGFSDALRPVKPYRWLIAGDYLTELPVTTMPIFKIPIHFSYLLYLAQYSRSLASTYFRFTLWLCDVTRTEPSLLLHPLDFIGEDDDLDLSFFPAMKMLSGKKIDLVSHYIEILKTRFRPTTIAEHIGLIEQRSDIPNVVPRFSHGF